MKPEWLLIRMCFQTRYYIVPTIGRQSNQSTGQPSRQPLNHSHLRKPSGAPGAGRPQHPRSINFKASWELGITARTPTVWALFGEWKQRRTESAGRVHIGHHCTIRPTKGDRHWFCFCFPRLWILEVWKLQIWSFQDFWILNKFQICSNCWSQIGNPPGLKQ